MLLVNKMIRDVDSWNAVTEFCWVMIKAKEDAEPDRELLGRNLI
jgi:hypothetical protein